MAGAGIVGAARFPLSAETIERECPNCGEPAFLLARSCPACGSARAMGRVGMMVAGALVLLLLAVATASVVVLGWHQLAAATETGEATAAPVAMGSLRDPSWLANAMSECDAQARADAESGVLHFLVTPLAPAEGDLAAWRPKAINAAGNGIMLRAEDVLDALRRGALRVYAADYDFSVLDPSGEELYRWRPSQGVAKFAAADPGELPTFTVRFRTAYTGNESVEGGPFTRQKAACYWVNAIIRK